MKPLRPQSIFKARARSTFNLDLEIGRSPAIFRIVSSTLPSSAPSTLPHACRSVFVFRSNKMTQKDHNFEKENGDLLNLAARKTMKLSPSRPTFRIFKCSNNLKFAGCRSDCATTTSFDASGSQVIWRAVRAFQNVRPRVQFQFHINQQHLPQRMACSEAGRIQRDNSQRPSKLVPERKKT